MAVKTATLVAMPMGRYTASKPPPLYRYCVFFTNKENAVDTSETSKGPGCPTNQPVVENTQSVDSPEAAVSGGHSTHVDLAEISLATYLGGDDDVLPGHEQ